MKKMSTLFKREFQGEGKKRIIILHPEVKEGNEWVLSGEGVATRKYDGTACAVINGEFYKRYDAKAGRPIPEGAIPCQPEPDPVTGHHPCWVKVGDEAESKWHRVALENYIKANGHPADGTYEAVGPHFQGNPDRFSEDTLVKHGAKELEGIERSFEGIKKYLAEHEIEGIVFHRGNGDMCKIRRKDFGFAWPVKNNK